MSLWGASKHKVYTDKTQQLLKNGHVLNNTVIVSEVKKWKKKVVMGADWLIIFPMKLIYRIGDFMTILRLIGNPLPKIGSRCYAGRRKKYDALLHSVWKLDHY